MQHLDDGIEQPPIWAIFGDLMAALVGVFVLLLVWVIGYQLELSQTLKQEIEKRQQAEQRRSALEQALATPLANGRITLKDGRIGISGSVLFDLNSAALQPNGRTLLKSLVPPLTVYLQQNQQILMVSGFTDDLPINKGNLNFVDNWELSAQRSLTVTRTLINEGMPSNLVFAAAFGAEQPVAPNSTAQNRAQNRRVELAPVPQIASSAQ